MSYDPKVGDLLKLLKENVDFYVVSENKIEKHNFRDFDWIGYEANVQDWVIGNTIKRRDMFKIDMITLEFDNAVKLFKEIQNANKSHLAGME